MFQLSFKLSYPALIVALFHRQQPALRRLVRNQTNVASGDQRTAVMREQDCTFPVGQCRSHELVVSDILIQFREVSPIGLDPARHGQRDGNWLLPEFDCPVRGSGSLIDELKRCACTVPTASVGAHLVAIQFLDHRPSNHDRDTLHIWKQLAPRNVLEVTELNEAVCVGEDRNLLHTGMMVSRVAGSNGTRGWISAFAGMTGGLTPRTARCVCRRAANQIGDFS